MGYHVFKEKKSWSIIWHGGGLKRHRVRKDTPGLGFDQCQSFEEAKALAKQLNTELAHTRRRQSQVRVEEIGQSAAALLPDAITKEFERLGGFRVKHWLAVKRAILACNLTPDLWYKERRTIYSYFEKKAYSLKYIVALRYVLNMYLDLYGETRSVFIKHIPPPDHATANALRRAYESFKGRKRPSGRLSFALLKSHKTRFSPTQYKALYISIAFGLRPEEVDRSLKETGKWAIQKGHLHVYQYKLEREEHNPLKRWKKIPIKTKEQEEASKLIEEQDFKLPYDAKMRGIKDLYGRPVSLYGGRKEFYPSMKALYPTHEVWKWMGHKSPETAAKYYDDPAEDAPEEVA